MSPLDKSEICQVAIYDVLKQDKCFYGSFFPFSTFMFLADAVAYRTDVAVGLLVGLIDIKGTMGNLFWIFGLANGGKI